MGRELLTPDETRKLDNNSCILLIRGCDAIIDRKYNTFKHPFFGETEDGGAKPYVHDIEAAKKEEKLRFLTDESLKYYEDKAKKDESVHILELTMDEVFAYNPVPKKIFSDEELEENRRTVKRSVKEVVRKKEKVSEKEKKSVQMEEEKLSELLKMHPYTEAQLEEIITAVESNIPYEKILLFADIHNTADKMKELRLKYTKDTTS